MLDARGFQYLDGTFDVIQGSGDPCQVVVLIVERRLDVHRHVVYKASIDEVLEHSRVGPIGVQLDLDPQGLDAAYELGQIVMNGGLPARDHDPIEEVVVFPDERLHFFPGDLVIAVRVEDYVAVVAERAPEVAPRKIDGRDHMAVPVQEGGLDEADDPHVVALAGGVSS